MARKPTRGRQRDAAGRVDIAGLETVLSSLSGLSIEDLKKAWTDRFKADPPKMRSRDLLLRLFAWRLQADSIGGLDAETSRKLRTIARALERDGSYEPKIRNDLSAGVVLTREWKGIIHKAIVVAGGFQYLGKKYGSLSDIARTITGTRWSGPRFFGLEQRAERGARKVSP